MYVCVFVCAREYMRAHVYKCVCVCYLINHFVTNRITSLMSMFVFYFRLLQSSKLFIGLGFPYEGSVLI